MSGRRSFPLPPRLGNGASRTGSGRNLQQSSLLELHECEALVAGFALTRSDSLHDDSLGRTFSTPLALPCRAGRAGALTVSFSVREGSDPFHAEARRRGARAEDFLRDLRASALPCLPCRVAPAPLSNWGRRKGSRGRPRVERIRSSTTSSVRENGGKSDGVRAKLATILALGAARMRGAGCRFRPDPIGFAPRRLAGPHVFNATRVTLSCRPRRGADGFVFRT